MGRMAAFLAVIAGLAMWMAAVFLPLNPEQNGRAIIVGMVLLIFGGGSLAIAEED